MQGLQQIQQVLGAERLGEKVIHAGLLTAVSVLGQRPGGKRYDGHTTGRSIQGADPLGGGESIHHWHVAIHQNHVEFALLQTLDR